MLLRIFFILLLSLIFFVTGVPPDSSSSPSSKHLALQTTPNSCGTKQSQTCDRRLSQFLPSGPYLVVDTAKNHVYLRKGTKTLYTAMASTGSGATLIDPRNSTKGWKFDTPRGIFTITSKLVNPIWIKPDWTFLEEGKPVPRNIKDRAEAGVLGNYALGFGKGYFIHGTLYTRLLGSNITHGCIRLGDEDLDYVYKTVSVGTMIMIF